MTRGRADEALGLAREAVDGCRAQHDRFQECTAHEILAAAYAATGAHAEAERAAREAVAMMDAAPPFRARILATLARVLLARGLSAEALEIATRAENAQGAAAIWDASVDLAIVDTLRASGQHAEARRAAQRAHERMLAVSDRFLDRRWVASFLALPQQVRLAQIAAGALTE